MLCARLVLQSRRRGSFLASIHAGARMSSVAFQTAALHGAAEDPPVLPGFSPEGLYLKFVIGVVT